MTNFEWVSARSRCSVARVFQEVKLGVENDVKVRNSLRGENAAHRFDTTANNGSFVVFIQGNNLYSSVIFYHTTEGISVRDSEDRIIVEATLSLSPEGECRLKVRGQECEFWQFRRMALEALFFETG